MKTTYQDAPPYVTKDGSEIRELLHPAAHPAPAGQGRVSLAEAIVPPGGETFLHRHPVSEEIYHVTAGQGVMELDGERFAVRPGDSVRIAPGAAHRLFNEGVEPLRVLCVCSPPYSHQDTELA